MYSAKVPAFSLEKSPAGPHSSLALTLLYTLTFFLGVGVCVCLWCGVGIVVVVLLGQICASLRSLSLFDSYTLFSVVGVCVCMEYDLLLLLLIFGHTLELAANISLPRRWSRRLQFASRGLIEIC